jgi:hypothetical protein
MPVKRDETGAAGWSAAGARRRSRGGRSRVSSGWLLGGAAALVLLAVLLVIPWMWHGLLRALRSPSGATMIAQQQPPQRADEAPRPPSTAGPAAPPPARARPAPPLRAEPPPRAAPGAEAPEAPRDEEPETVEEAPAMEISDSPYGVPGGLAVFPPMGSQPLLRGLIVPEDFEVPEGFVKHYQVTDEGEQLPPILMFHPDYEQRDASGKPIEIPEDRVVPPELAPAGMPIEILELPDERG